MNHAIANSSGNDVTGFSSDEAGAKRTSSGTANAAAWLLVVAFVGLVLSVVVPAMGDGANTDLAAALLFMGGLAATLAGTGMALVSSVSTARTLLGALVMLGGLVLMYGIVPSIAALGVVLVGAATQISSLPGD